jgi:hypothetical protein
MLRHKIDQEVARLQKCTSLGDGGGFAVRAGEVVLPKYD